MELWELLAIVGASIVGSWTALWYKLGKLTREVKEHNRLLHELQKAMERLLTRGG